jgi:hypothetical protein
MSELWLELILTGLIAWRLSVLLVLDDGPANVFFRLREWAGPRTYFDGSQKPGFQETHRKPVFILDGVLSCVGCMSLWMAPLALLVVRSGPEEVALVLGGWAIATGTQRALA